MGKRPMNKASLGNTQAYVISTERLARRWGNIENLLRHEHLQSIDDQNQLRIRLETAAVEGIFELAQLPHCFDQLGEDRYRKSFILFKGLL
jgi:hypothetical protein